MEWSLELPMLLLLLGWSALLFVPWRLGSGSGRLPDTGRQAGFSLLPLKRHALSRRSSRFILVRRKCPPRRGTHDSESAPSSVC